MGEARPPSQHTISPRLRQQLSRGGAATKGGGWYYGGGRTRHGEGGGGLLPLWHHKRGMLCSRPPDSRTLTWLGRSMLLCLPSSLRSWIGNPRYLSQLHLNHQLGMFLPYPTQSLRHQWQRQARRQRWANGGRLPGLSRRHLLSPWFPFKSATHLKPWKAYLSHTLTTAHDRRKVQR